MFSKSKTLNQVGAELLAAGKTADDLELVHLKDVDPYMLPPKMRAKLKSTLNPHPVFVKESSKYGAKKQEEIEKQEKYLPKTQKFTRVRIELQIH